jgi:hypothetical protein
MNCVCPLLEALFPFLGWHTTQVFLFSLPLPPVKTFLFSIRMDLYLALNWLFVCFL